MKRMFGTFLVAVMFVVLLAPQAQAATLDEALKRIDQIITQMQTLRAEFDTLTAQVSSAGSGGTPAVLGASTKTRLSGPVQFGETNDDVKVVQLLLRTDSEIYPYGVASGFFGPKTQEAIRNLQTRFNLDPVGVVGPATTALLEAFFAKYPDDEFPSNALATDPRVLGASTSNTDGSVEAQLAAVQAELAKLTGSNSNTTPTGTVSTGSVSSINAEIDRGEAVVVIFYKNGEKKKLYADGNTEAEVIEDIARRTSLLESVVKATITFENSDSSSSSSKDNDEDDADDALNDAEDAIDEATDAIEEAEDDGDDIDWAEDTLEEAEDLFDEAEDAFDDEDWDKAVELAEEAEDMAKEAEDRIGEEEGSSKGDEDEIEEIEVEVDEDEANVTVKYENDDDYEFTIEDDKEDEIIEEIADELDIDEDDVEDLVQWDFGDVDEITVIIHEDDEEAEVTVTYESGVKRRFTLDEDNEDRIIRDVAELIDEDEDDVEDWADFDYN